MLGPLRLYRLLAHGPEGYFGQWIRQRLAFVAIFAILVFAVGGYWFGSTVTSRTVTNCAYIHDLRGDIVQVLKGFRHHTGRRDRALFDRSIKRIGHITCPT
jgi:hypothetical protein